jgi:hypothetical protein
LAHLFGVKHPSLHSVRTPFVVYAAANNLCHDDIAVECAAFYLLTIDRSSIPDKRRPEPVPVEPGNVHSPATLHWLLLTSLNGGHALMIPLIGPGGKRAAGFAGGLFLTRM